MRDPGSIRLHQSMFGSGSLPAILQEVRRRHCLVVTMNPQRRSQCRTSRHSIHPNGLVRGFLEQADEAEAAHPPPPLRSTADQTPFALVRRGTTAPFGFVTRSAKSASSPRNNASGVANLSMRQAWAWDVPCPCSRPMVGFKALPQTGAPFMEKAGRRGSKLPDAQQPNQQTRTSSGERPCIH